MSIEQMRKDYEHTVEVEARSSCGRSSVIHLPNVGTVHWALEHARSSVGRLMRYARDDRPDASFWSQIWHRLTARVFGIDRPWSHWWIQYGRLEDLMKSGLMSSSWNLFIEGEKSDCVFRSDAEILGSYWGGGGRGS